MKKIIVTPRKDWKKKVESLGFSFHSLTNPYWSETSAYTFSMAEVLKLEAATNTLHAMCIKAAEYVIENKLFDRLGIPSHMVPLILRSWENDEPSIYGRFDLAYDGKNPPKMLEYNADTPTSLFEASVVQWHWLQDYSKDNDQWNSIHEKLVDYWRENKGYLKMGPLYFTAVNENPEDLITTEYLRDTAIQAGYTDTEFLFIEDLGWDDQAKEFVDGKGAAISNIFKLYPWEWMANETFGPAVSDVDARETLWIEPAWKMIISNKGILPILWELFPGHENLLPAFFDSPNGIEGDYVEKPLLSREGANVTLFDSQGKSLESSDGEYGEEGFVYQKKFDIPCIDGKYPILGSWIIGQESAGLGIRESSTRITNNVSEFVPHLIV